MHLQHYTLSSVLASLIFLSSCGPTEVSVEAEEINVNTEFNTSIEVPDRNQIVLPTTDAPTPVIIPTPVGLEAMNEALQSALTVSEELQKTADSFGEIFASIDQSTPTVKNSMTDEPKNIDLNHLLLNGFSVNKESTDKWSFSGLKNSYIGVTTLDEDGTIEVLIFESPIIEPSTIASITADILSTNGYSNNVLNRNNLFMSCAQSTLCIDFVSSLEKRLAELSLT
ncbi:MAG: hypothetical protein FI729_05805 [SAR202 cluster bacterium]|nr:hypothetical protein [SAR202 cluster bacterium]|tara:strand:- start:328 stop:1005 length:678 start_codon:yes stop_codon:yes gene_type:complete